MYPNWKLRPYSLRHHIILVTGLKEIKLELSCERILPGWLAFTTDKQAEVGVEMGEGRLKLTD